MQFWDDFDSKWKTIGDQVKGKIVLITGSTDGIGERLAHRLLEQDAGLIIIVGRNQGKIDKVRNDLINLKKKGAVDSILADLSLEIDCTNLIRYVLEKYGYVDILINNAGRSISRQVKDSYHRFHDFTRTMELNYYGAIRLILGILPVMRKRRSGIIVNVGSFNAIAFAPNFAAYSASKAALDAFSQVCNNELKKEENVSISTVFMPLVDTKMLIIENKDLYPKLTRDEACVLIEKAIVSREVRVFTKFGRTFEVIQCLFPKYLNRLINYHFSKTSTILKEVSEGEKNHEKEIKSKL